MTDTTMKAGVPWHLWAVGVLSLLWNGFGAYDFVMSMLQGEAYWRASGLSESMIAHYSAMPGWMMVAWIAGVWGALLGSILLLLRRKWAFHAFVVSLAGALVSVVYTYLLSDGAAALGPMAIMPVVIAAIALFLAWYSSMMSGKGVLR